MKLLFALLLVVFNSGRLSLADDDSIRLQGHWQCSLPQNKSVNEIVKFRTKLAFKIIGYLSWMTDKLKYISCYQKGLRTVPKGLDNDVQILNLGRNSITNVRKNDFAEYKQLEAVYMDENCYSANIEHKNVPLCSQDFINIDAGAFAYLSHLNLIDLSYNNIKTIPANLPKSLKSLAIEMAKLGQLKSSDFKNLKNLQIVLLDRNCIEVAMSKLCKGNFSVDNFTFSSNNLSYLNFQLNNLKWVPRQLFTRNLLGINLQFNPIHVVRSDDFTACPNITSITLSWTSKYEQIPLKIENGAFDNLFQLTYLDLSGNMLSSLPDLSSHTQLSWIGLAYNCLKALVTNPTNISSLPLFELPIYGNTFCSSEAYPIKKRIDSFKIGEAFIDFSKLETIMFQRFTIINSPDIDELYWTLSYGYHYNYVDENSLKVLQNLPKLKRLSLAFSGIRSIDMSMFCKFDLSVVDLGANEIHQLSVNSDFYKESETTIAPFHLSYSPETLKRFLIRHQQSLQKIKNKHFNMLILSRNALTNLPNNAFKCFSQTTFLDLSRNQIRYIQNDTFAHMINLEKLNVRFNPIRHIYPSSQNGLAKLNILKLNYTTFQGEFTLKFLLHTSNNISLYYSDITDNIYRLLSAYRKNCTKFHSVVSITFSNIPVSPLDVSNNDPIFEPFPNLKQITLNYAQLSISPESNFFKGVSNVTQVTLRNCLLREFPYKALKALPKLRYLDLSHNYIEYLNKSWFENISNLVSFNLSHNFIRYIVPETLHCLVDKGLRKLDLSRNLITDVGVNIIDRYVLSKLRFLDLRYNPIICYCSLRRNFGWLIYCKKCNQLYIAGFLPACYSVVNDYYGGCLTCNSASGILSQPPSLFLYSLSSICEEQLVTALTISFTLSILVLMLLPVLYNCKPLRNRLITSWLRTNLGRVNRDNKCTNSSVKYAFDAFVIYDTTDSSIGDWVDFSMIPKLKNSFPPLKIGVVEKGDWCGLIPAVQQLLLRIEASYKTIVLLSDIYAQSLQCKYILAVLEQRVYSQGDDRCIIITFHKHPPTGKAFQIRKRRNQWSVLNLPKLKKDDSVFVELLRNAISTNPYVV